MPMLTDYDTGDPVFVRKDEIKSARPLPATTTRAGDELDKRTLIFGPAGESFTVKETVEEVMADEVPPSSDYKFRK